MKSYLRQAVEKSFLLVFVLSLAACQTSTQNLPSPTIAYRTATPLPALAPEPNPVIEAFKRLEELDSYRMTVTFMNGTEIRPRYLLEKKGQGHLRINYIGLEYSALVIDNKFYYQMPSGEWVVSSNEKDEGRWLVYPFMAGDNGCLFDFQSQPIIEFIYLEDDLFRETVIGFTHAEGVKSNPANLCKLTLRKGIPFLIVSEALLEDGIFLTRFTDFDGEDIDPIVAPTITK